MSVTPVAAPETDASAGRRAATTQTLHLVDVEHCGALGMQMVGELVRTAPEPQRQGIVLIGGSDHERLAHRCGLASVDRLHPPGALAVRAVSGLSRFIDCRGKPRTICAWGGGSASLAFAGARSIPLNICSVSPIVALSSPFATARLRHALSSARSVVFFEKQAHRMSVRKLLAGAARVRLATPPITGEAPTAGSRQRVRDALSAEESDLVLLLIGAPAHAVDARAFAQMVASCGVLGIRTIGVVHPGTRQLERGLRVLEKQTWPARMVVTDTPAHALLPGVDVAVWRSDPPAETAQGRFESALPILQAAAFGVPIVANHCAASDAVWEIGMGELTGEIEPLQMVASVRRQYEDRAEHHAGNAPVEHAAAEVHALWDEAERH